MRLFVLNEGNLAGLLWRVARGERPVVVKVMAWLRPAQPLLERLAAVLERWGRLTRLGDAFPDLPWVEGVPGRGFYNDVFATVEAAGHRRFGVDTVTDWNGGYDYPARKAVSWWIDQMVPLVLLLEWLTANRPGDAWSLEGAPTDLDWLYRTYFGVPAQAVRPTRPWSRLVNAGMATVLGLIGMVWLCLRVRFRVDAEPYLIMADGRSDFDDHLFAAIVDDPRDLIIYHRNRELEAERSGKPSLHPSCRKENGRVGLAALPSRLAEMGADLVGLWRRFGAEEPALFAMIAAQAVKRQFFRALLERFPVRFFWARDDYSVDHVVRSQEIRRLGGRTMGVNHGLPLATYFHAWREIDCDIYFTFGRHLHAHAYRDAWPPYMEVIPIGNPRLGPDFVARMGRTKSRDIAVFPMVTAHNDKMMAAVTALARHFPDRTVYFKMKAGRRTEEILDYIRGVELGPDNLVSCTDDPYELLLRVGYAVTSGSTLSAEALQFNVPCFVMDIVPELDFFYYRNFPAMVVKDGPELIARIEAIEAGTAEFAFDTLGDLIELPPRNVYEIIRTIMGLAPREARRN